MTMQKPRNPLHPTYPAARCIELLTVEGVADVIGKSVSMARALADDSRDPAVLPGCRDMMALDDACILAGGSVAPYANFMQRRAKHLLDTAGELVVDALDLGAAVGELQAAVADAVAPDGPGGSSITASEAERIIQSRGNVRAVGDKVETDTLKAARAE